MCEAESLQEDNSNCTETISTNDCAIVYLQSLSHTIEKNDLLGQEGLGEEDGGGGGFSH